MAYLSREQNQKFLGNGESNSQGVDLTSFLEEYDPKKYLSPCNTVDTLVFTYNEINGTKKISRLLLIKRGNHPSIGWWALPGGFVEYKENLDTAALRELQEETGIEDIEVEQLKSYGDYDRDPRTRIITTAYVSIVPEGRLKAQAGDDAKDAGWFSITDKLISNYIYDGVVLEKHSLILKDEDSDVITESIINVSYKENAILKQKTYSVEETKQLAADHGAIILEGYHYILNKINQK